MQEFLHFIKGIYKNREDRIISIDYYVILYLLQDGPKTIQRLRQLLDKGTDNDLFAYIERLTEDGWIFNKKQHTSTCTKKVKHFFLTAKGRALKCLKDKTIFKAVLNMYIHFRKHRMSMYMAHAYILIQLKLNKKMETCDFYPCKQDYGFWQKNIRNLRHYGLVDADEKDDRQGNLYSLSLEGQALFY